MDELGRASVEFGSKLCSFTTLNLLPLGPGIASPEMGYQWSDHMSPDDMRKGIVEAVVTSERDVPVMPVFLSGKHRALDLNRLFEPKGLRKTDTYNEGWRRVHAERQLLGLIGHPRRPLAVVCFGRSIHEREFEPAEFARFEAVRALLEQSLPRLLRSPHAPSELQSLVGLIARGAPFEGAVFDERGRMVWLSDDAVARYDAAVAQFGRARLVSCFHPCMDQWRAAAVLALRSRTQPVSRLLVKTGADQGPSGQLEVTTLPRARGAPGLAFVAPVCPAPGEIAQPVVPAPAAAAVAGLTPRQREVAMLAVKGHSTIGISAITGASAETIRTHLRAIYRRLGVGNRAELTALILTGRRS